MLWVLNVRNGPKEPIILFHAKIKGKQQKTFPFSQTFLRNELWHCKFALFPYKIYDYFCDLCVPLQPVVYDGPYCEPDDDEDT